MRVTVPEPVVVGPSTSYGGFVLVADGGAGASLRSPVGGIVARPDDFNPERILVDTALLAEPPELWVGDHPRGPVTGVVGYSFSNFQILATEPIPPAVPGSRDAVPAPARPTSDGALTLATYNVLNLHPGVGERMDRLAATIVRELGSPDLIALQEMQDASGPADDGVVAGAPTFERLIRAIETAGGPTYSFRQIDPVDGSEGGQPGGNIRVGYLFREDRLELPPALLSLPAARDGAPEPGPTTAVELRMVDGAPHLAPNPGRVAPEHPCFTGVGREDYAATRRSLAIELRFGTRALFVVDNHWKSKRGDGRLFGADQPPVLHSEEQRVCQGRLVADFVRRLLAADPDAWVIVAGDLNEHEFRPPVQELEAAGLTDLVWRVPGAERYSYNFEGNSQILDHVLVSPAVLRDAVAVPTIVHVNTDRPASQAASDHDPIRVVLAPRLTEQPRESAHQEISE
jgi:predicted extracellular nuclease